MRRCSSNSGAICGLSGLCLELTESYIALSEIKVFKEREDSVD